MYAGLHVSQWGRGRWCVGAGRQRQADRQAGGFGACAYRVAWAKNVRAASRACVPAMLEARLPVVPAQSLCVATVQPGVARHTQ